MSRPLRIAHRGAAGYLPENTMRSFARALEFPIDLIETDVRATADGAFVLCHDPRLDRTMGAGGLIREATLDRLTKIRSPEGDHVPTLAELFALVRGRTGLMLEIKEEGLADRLVRYLDDQSYSGVVMFASFHHQEIYRLAKANGSAQTIALLHGHPIQQTAFAVDAGAKYAGINSEFATAPFIDALHAAGIGVFVYTVNDPVEIAQVMALGVDGIISDFPDRLSSVTPG